MGHSTHRNVDTQGAEWMRRMVRLAGALGATGAIMLVGAGSSGAAGTIAITPIQSTSNPPAHTEGVADTNLQVATFTDSDGVDPASNFTATVFWGDGSANTACSSTSSTCVIAGPTGGPYTITTSHTFPDEFNNPAGTSGYPINITVSDSDTSSGTTLSPCNCPGKVAVKDKNLTPPAPVSLTGTPGSALTNVNLGTFTDSNPLASLTDGAAVGGGPEYSIQTIDWGDGSAVDTATLTKGTCTSTGCPFTVTGSHTYNIEGTYNIRVNIQDGLSTLTAITWADTVTIAGAACAGNAAAQPHFYTLDGFGGVHAQGGGGAPTAFSYWNGWDIARGISVLPDGSGGVTLDAFGGVHPFAVGTCAAPSNLGTYSYFGWNIARGIALAPWATSTAPAGYTVDGYGGIHPFGGAPAAGQSAYWNGFDIARGIVINPGSTPTAVGGYTLDGYGGLHPFGNAAAATGFSYWGGWDIVRGVMLEPASTGFAPAGYTVDGYGGVHPFNGAAPVSNSSVFGSPNTVRGITFGSGGGYTLDLFGGVHAFGSATAVATSAYWSGFDIARGISSSGQGGASRKV
jgi:hypothetical protein